MECFTGFYGIVLNLCKSIGWFHQRQVRDVHEAEGVRAVFPPFLLNGRPYLATFVKVGGACEKWGFPPISVIVMVERGVFWLGWSCREQWAWTDRNTPRSAVWTRVVLALYGHSDYPSDLTGGLKWGVNGVSVVRRLSAIGADGGVTLVFMLGWTDAESCWDILYCIKETDELNVIFTPVSVLVLPWLPQRVLTARNASRKSKTTWPTGSILHPPPWTVQAEV